MNGKLDDEKRLLRLFRCLNAQEQAEMLKTVAIRLLKRYPIDNYRHSQNPELEAKQELTEPVPERLYRVIPCESYLTDLHDYDFHPAEVAWEDDVVDVLLGSSLHDAASADFLANAYLDGANKYDYPLTRDFGGTEEELIQDTTEEARKLIRAWRETIIAMLEERSGATCQQERENKNDNNV